MSREFSHNLHRKINIKPESIAIAVASSWPCQNFPVRCVRDGKTKTNRKPNARVAIGVDNGGVKQIKCGQAFSSLLRTRTHSRVVLKYKSKVALTVYTFRSRLCAVMPCRARTLVRVWDNVQFIRSASHLGQRAVMPSCSP